MQLRRVHYMPGHACRKLATAVVATKVTVCSVQVLTKVPGSGSSMGPGSQPAHLSSPMS